MSRKRTPKHQVNKRQRAAAIAVLESIVTSPTAAEYVRQKAAQTLLGDSGSRADDAPGTIIFLPKTSLHPGQRADESAYDFKDRRRAWVEGRRACYCQSLGEAYDPMKPLPCWPYPTPGSDTALEDEVDRMADEWEAAEIERQRPKPRPALVEVLGPKKEGSSVVIFDGSTPEGREDRDRWRAEAIAAGHEVQAAQ
jgi:hypothetical protein